MMLDDRGTGASQGKWDSWGQRTQDDYSEVLDWIQAQGWSNGSVATTGGSYMGITSCSLPRPTRRGCRGGKPQGRKGRLGRHSHVGCVPRRDVPGRGGGRRLHAALVGLTTGFSACPPRPCRRPGRLGADLAEHLRNAWDFAGQKPWSSTLGREPPTTVRSTDCAPRRPRSSDPGAGGHHRRLVGHLPARRAAAVRAADGLGERRKKLFMSPHYHTDSGPALEDPDLKNKWFDHWLQGVDNGVENTPSVNLYPIGGDRWEHPGPGRCPTPATRRRTSTKRESLGFSAPAEGGGDKAPLLPAQARAHG